MVKNLAITSVLLLVWGTSFGDESGRPVEIKVGLSDNSSFGPELQVLLENHAPYAVTVSDFAWELASVPACTAQNDGEVVWNRLIKGTWFSREIVTPRVTQIEPGDWWSAVLLVPVVKDRRECKVAFSASVLGAPVKGSARADTPLVFKAETRPLGTYLPSLSGPGFAPAKSGLIRVRARTELDESVRRLEASEGESGLPLLAKILIENQDASSIRVAIADVRAKCTNGARFALPLHNMAPPGLSYGPFNIGPKSWVTALVAGTVWARGDHECLLDVQLVDVRNLEEVRVIRTVNLKWKFDSR